jgi:mRNA-degrading endonuclease toxin of MazEF toxin-antitoxin module
VYIVGIPKTSYGLTTPRCRDWQRESNVFVVPVTSRDRGLRHQVPIASQSSGLGKLPSFTRPEDARAVAYQRLDRRLGAVTPDELAAVRRILRAFLDL